MPYYKRSYKRKSVRRTYKRKSVKKARRSPLKKMVRREIARTEEVKCVQYYNDAKLLHTATSASVLDNIIELGPDGVNLTISQGTGQGNRIGNRIMTKSLKFKGTLIALPYNAASNPTVIPQQVKIWIFYDKTDPTAVPDPRTNFFQNGNSVRAIQGQLTDFWAPINTERYAVLASKTFKLGFALNATTDAPSTSITTNAIPNNDFKLNANFSFDLTKHYPKVVKFADGGNTPTTRGLFAMFEYVRADGTSNGTSDNTLCVGVEYMLDYHFTDA